MNLIPLISNQLKQDWNMDLKGKAIVITGVLIGAGSRRRSSTLN